MRIVLAAVFIFEDDDEDEDDDEKDEDEQTIWNFRTPSKKEMVLSFFMEVQQTV